MKLSKDPQTEENYTKTSQKCLPSSCLKYRDLDG